MTTIANPAGAQAALLESAQPDHAVGSNPSPQCGPACESGCEDFESLTNPNRGLVLGILASSLLWAAAILAVGALLLRFR